jgi:hypothetical protein
MAPQPGTILRRIKQEKILRVRTRRLYLGRAHWTFGSPPPPAPPLVEGCDREGGECYDLTKGRIGAGPDR